MSKMFFGLGLLGILVSTFGLSVVIFYFNVMTTLTSLPSEYWGWPIAASISIAGFWMAFYFRVSKRKRLWWALTLPMLAFPIFDSFAYLTFFENEAVELIYGVPLIGDLLSSWNFATSQNLEEILTFSNVSDAAFPLVLYVSWVIFLVMSIKGAKAVSCPNCGANVTEGIAFCGSCGTAQRAN
jgi:hypothetical protein